MGLSFRLVLLFQLIATQALSQGSRRKTKEAFLPNVERQGAWKPGGKADSRAHSPQDPPNRQRALDDRELALPKGHLASSSEDTVNSWESKGGCAGAGADAEGAEAPGRCHEYSHLWTGLINCHTLHCQGRGETR